MLKRKFSFGITPLKIPSRAETRAETRALKEALAANAFDVSPISPPASPLINRRPLDFRTEAQLHAACAAIVNGYVRDENLVNLPNDKLHQTSSTVHKAHHASVPGKARAQSLSQLPSELPASTMRHNDYRQRPEPVPEHLLPGPRGGQDFAHAGNERRRDQKHSIASAKEVQQQPSCNDSMVVPQTRALFAASFPMSPVSRPKTAPGHSSELSYATPKSASTDQCNNTSTAITSAALTPARASKENSKQFLLDNDSYQAAISEADTEAAVWMRAERERRKIGNTKQLNDMDGPPRLTPRPGSRDWKSGLREFVQPIAPRRVTSRQSLIRNTSDNSAKTSSGQGWRSGWGLRHESSKGSLIERPRSASRVEAPIRDVLIPPARKEINLNRELPPLPSLDTWQEPEKESTPGPHIATLMRPTNKDKNKTPQHVARRLGSHSPPQLQTASAMVVVCKTDMTVTSANIKSADAILAPESTNSLSWSLSRCDDVESGGSEGGKSSSTQSKAPSSDLGVSLTDSTSPDRERSVNMNVVTEEVKSAEFSGMLEGNHVPGHAPSSSITKPSTSHMAHDENASNFSRKISIDNHGRIYDPCCPNLVEITALAQTPVKKSGNFLTLRKVFSRLDVKEKTKERTWMDKFEADGIKAGVIIQNESSPAPIIRY